MIDEAVQREIFEELLIAAVRKRATHVYVYATGRESTDVVFRLSDRLIRWHVEERIPPTEFVAVVRESFKKTSHFSDAAPQDGSIQRWVDEKQVQFRVATMLLTNQDNERQADVVRIEVIS